MTFIWPQFSAIVHTDGTMRRTNKAELGHQLEAQVERVCELPQSTTSTMVYIRDAMVVIQMMGVPIQFICLVILQTTSDRISKS